MMTVVLCRILVAACVAVGPVGCSDSVSESPKSTVTLSVTPSPAGETPTHVVLTCEPSGGEHRDAEAACAALAAVDGDFDRLTGDPSTVCVQVYEPVEAAATGTWQGREINWRKVFGNKCELSARTAPVF